MDTRGDNTGGRARVPHLPTIALQSRRQVAYFLIPCVWTVYEMAGPVLPDGFDVAASLVLTVAAAAFRVGLDVAASLMPAVAVATLHFLALNVELIVLAQKTSIFYKGQG